MDGFEPWISVAEATALPTVPQPLLPFLLHFYKRPKKEVFKSSETVVITKREQCKFFLKKMGQPRPLFRLFSVFSNKHQYNFYKYMRKYVHPVYIAGIRTHDLQNVSLFPITLRPGLLP